MLVLGLLMLLQRGAEPGVLYPQILLRFGLAAGHQIASEQLAAVLLEGFAEFGDLQHAFWAVQAIAHRVVAAFGQLLLDVLMQLVAGAGLHEAGVGESTREHRSAAQTPMVRSQAGSRNNNVQLDSFRRSKRSMPSRDGTGNCVTTSVARRLAASVCIFIERLASSMLHGVGRA